MFLAVCLLLMSVRGQILWQNHVSVIFEGFAEVKNSLIWMVLSLVSMLEVLVLKNLIQRTSQRVKWTSGARDMTTSIVQFTPSDGYVHVSSSIYTLGVSPQPISANDDYILSFRQETERLPKRQNKKYRIKRNLSPRPPQKNLKSNPHHNFTFHSP